MSLMPRVSVVMPVYNAAPYLPEALDSLLAQTLADFELVCVDDGSTDDSAAIIAEYAARDSRIELLRQANASAGAARNAGIDRASGDYLAFLDADDVFLPSLLEHAVARLDATGADVCVFDGRRFTGSVPAVEPGPGDYLRRRFLPEQEVFAPEDVADRLFQIVTPATWLKLYRRSFVVAEGLRFEVGAITDDVAFTIEALAAASRIAVLDEVLVLYRVLQSGNQSSRWDSDPMNVVQTIRELRRRLEARGALPRFERSFRNQCLNVLSHVLRNLRTPASYEFLHQLTHDELLHEFGLADHGPSYFVLPELRETLHAVRDLPARQSPLHPAWRGRTPSFPRRALRSLRRRLTRTRGGGR